MSVILNHTLRRFKMKVLVLFATFVVALTSAVPAAGKITPKTYVEINTNAKDNRIINGSPAVVGQFPWQVAIFATSTTSWFCGGSIISDRWVLTAAHCVQGAVRFILYAGGITVSGTETGRITLVSTVSIVHYGYNNFYNNDIALIQLPSAITFNDRIQPISLPPRGKSLGVNETVTVMGWGITSDTSTTVSDVLNWVNVRTISNADCARIFGSSYVVETTVCTVGNPNHGTCNGDSGGPLVRYDEDGKAVQVAVVSFGAENACEQAFPSGFVRTESVLEWIATSTGLNV